LAPYLGLQLKSMDPTWPFVVSALSLAAVTLGMVAAERALARQRAGPALSAEPTQPIRWAPTLTFLAACALGAAAFQWHGFVASAPLALRFANAAELPSLLPAFWVGFNLALVPAGILAKRTGALRTLVVGAVLAAAGNATAAFAPTLAALLGAQVLTGVGWALLLCSAFAAALDIGKGARAGLMGGALSATLAFAALSRIAYVSQTGPAPAQVVQAAWWAAAGFAACGGLVWLLRRRLVAAGV
jgi:MFS family permease